MKQISVLVLAAFILLAPTCKKGTQVAAPGLENIFGKWNWVSTSGGFAGKTITPAKVGYSVKIEFSNEGIYSKYKGDSLVDRKKITFSKQTSIRNHSEVWVISFTDDTAGFNESSIPMSVSFEGKDSLMLKEEVYDGFEHVYVRIK